MTETMLYTTRASNASSVEKDSNIMTKWFSRDFVMRKASPPPRLFSFGSDLSTYSQLVSSQLSAPNLPALSAMSQ